MRVEQRLVRTGRAATAGRHRPISYPVSQCRSRFRGGVSLRSRHTMDVPGECAALSMGERYGMGEATGAKQFGTTFPQRAENMG